MDLSLYVQELQKVGPTLLINLVAATFCGGVIGLERETTGKSAGLRTCVLVCVGAMIFTWVSYQMADLFGGDRTRIAAQIVTGIGFLGAGVIMREFGRGITGLTTAAIIWVVAGIGMLVGTGFVAGALLLTLFLILATLVLRRFEHWVNRKSSFVYRVVLPDDPRPFHDVYSLISVYSSGVHVVKVDRDGPDGPEFTLQFIGSNNERYDFLKMIYEIEGARILKLDEKSDHIVKHSSNV